MPALLKKKSGSFFSIVVLLEIYIGNGKDYDLKRKKKENFVLKFGEKLSCAERTDIL